MRLSSTRLQRDIADTASEVSTGVHADAGLALGRKAGVLIQQKQRIDDIATLTETNTLVLGRLGATQESLDALLTLADQVTSDMIAARGSEANQTVLVPTARRQLDQLTELSRTSFNGTFVFSGSASDAPPISDYFSVPQTAVRTAAREAFSDHFGFWPEDVRTSMITATDMSHYLRSRHEPLFHSNNWSTTTGSGDAPVFWSRISASSELATSFTFQETGAERLYLALSALIEVGAAELSQATYEELATFVAESASEAAAQLATTQSQLGFMQQQVSAANDRMAAEQRLLEQGVSKLQDVDLLEASTRLNNLTSQLEMSYAVTNRLLKLRLLNFID
jgi:flagellar hook-associated protein 3 FlgL